ncbi:MAG TPA: guanylate kinase [Gaiellaceae bacterium]|nr:guanylate kinase [Gaiellaceae bacterium]
MGSSTGRPLKVFVITGPSGAGKGTLEQELLRRMPGRLELAVSATTRERRPNEVDGVHYWFKSNEEFDRLVAEEGLLEWVAYVGNRYGTLRSEIVRIHRQGRAPLLDLEIEGALHVRDEVPGAVTVFVDAPLDELERRLRARATESSGQIEDRLRIAREQRRFAGEFDYVVVNDRLDRAAAELERIVDGELAATATITRP